MRILLVGAGGVGTAFARIAARRPFAELVIADYDLGRAQRAAAARDGYQAVQLDARDEQAAVGLLSQHRCDVLMNATDPRFVMPLFRAALQAGTHYLDMAMSLSQPHPDEPYRQTGVKLGDEQFALAPDWEQSGKYGLGAEFIGVLRTLHKLGLDCIDPVRVGSASVSPRDVVAACLPDPAGLGDKMSGLTCAGTWVTGTGIDGTPREVYLYHVVDNAWSMAEYGSQAVVWQTAVNPVVALELIDAGVWSGAGVLGPEALPPRPFLGLLNDYGSPWALEERPPV